jgi:signal transduction histidine kinase
MVSKPRLCDIFETALLAGWIEISGAWRSSFREPDVARTRRCEGCVVQDQATHASKDDGKSEGGSPPLARIRTTWRGLNRWHSGIGLRLLARVLLFSSAITLLLTLLQLYFDYRRDVGTIDRQISEIERSYRRSLGEGLWNLDARQLELQVDGILHLPDIRFVEVREATDRADPMVVTAGSHQANADVHREFPIFHMNRGAEQTLGVLSIEATLDDVYRRLFDTAIVILISQGAKTFVVSFFILYIVNRLITRHLVTAAKFLGGYDLRRSPPPLRLERRPPQQVDELDQLVGAFNGMCVENSRLYRDLEDREYTLQHQRNELRTLANRLMHAQDDERRRIATMLHETTAQDLAALKMLLARLNRTAVRLSDDERDALTESISLAEQSMTEIRTVSYLLHPPFLDEAGLLAALRWYAGGFAERSGIKVDLDLPERFERLPLDTETVLFRIVQESLTNIHRHAGSKTARIRLEGDAETLVLEIEDRGHGIPDAALKHITSGGGGGGVGIASMSERVEQLGGRLDVTSSDHGTTGTTVRVWLPLVKDAG